MLNMQRGLRANAGNSDAKEAIALRDALSNKLEEARTFAKGELAEQDKIVSAATATLTTAQENLAKASARLATLDADARALRRRIEAK
jgi:hypothetical protein